MNHLRSSAAFVLVLLAGASLSVYGQTTQGTGMAVMDQQLVTGGFGLTYIDGEPYYLVNLAPELTFGKVGVGIDLNLRFNAATGKVALRKEDWDEPYDYVRMIRYIRYGMKKEPVYVRAGTLDYARLGHGSIIYYYLNSASYEKRKFGVELDLDFETFGFESMYSDLFGAGVFGFRPFVRPLKYSSLADIPIIGSFEVGATYAADFHPDAQRVWGSDAAIANSVDKGTLSIIGIDFGLPLLRLSSLNSTLYFDIAKIVDYGNGQMAGIDLNFTGLGVITIGGKYEYRWLGNQFIPAYFDALHERQRYVPDSSSGTFTSKAELLRHVTKHEGYYGELHVDVLGTFKIVGGYQAPAGVRNAGLLHLELQSADVLPSILLRAGYDKTHVGKVFRLDDNSLLFAEIGYLPVPWLAISTLYMWTFTEVKDAAGNVVGYKTQQRVEPKIGFLMRF